MEENEILGQRSKSVLYGIIIAEAAVAAVILITVTAVKYFFPGCYTELKGWYETNICADTDADEVLDIPYGDADEV